MPDELERLRDELARYDEDLERRDRVGEMSPTGDAAFGGRRLTREEWVERAREVFVEELREWGEQLRTPPGGTVEAVLGAARDLGLPVVGARLAGDGVSVVLEMGIAREGHVEPLRIPPEGWSR